MADQKGSPVLGLIWCALVVGALPAYSLYLDLTGLLIQGKVDTKQESISINYGDWSRSLAVTAAYLPAGEFAPSYARAEVDAATFDRLRPGSPVTVRYFPSRMLRQFILIPSARIEGFSLYSLAVDRFSLARHILYWALGLVALTLLWWKAHLNLAGWLLIPYVVFGIFRAFMPHAEPAPVAPVRSARATVGRVTDVTQIFETDQA